MMCALHKTPLDMLMYYDGQVNGRLQGLFNPVSYDVFPAYFAFQSFNELYALGNEAYSESDEDLPILAAVNDNIGKIIIPNVSDTSIDINLVIPENWEVSAYRVLDGSNGMVSQIIPDDISVAPNKIVLIECTKILH